MNRRGFLSSLIAVPAAAWAAQFIPSAPTTAPEWPLLSQAFLPYGSRFRYVRALCDIRAGDFVAHCGDPTWVTPMSNSTKDYLAGVAREPMNANQCGWVQVDGPVTVNVQMPRKLGAMSSM